MCTRVLWNSNDLAVVTGRSMDWPESTEPLIVAFPRGLERDGLNPPGIARDPNPLRWTSRYASLVTTIYGVGTVDGLNEAGLARMASTCKPPISVSAIRRNPLSQLPSGRSICLTGLQPLPRRSTFSRASTSLWSTRTATTPTSIWRSRTPAAIPRSSSTSRAQVDPSRPPVHSDDQRPDLRRAVGPVVQAGLLPPQKRHALPGNVNAVDRFQRAAYYQALLPKPKSGVRRWPAS